MKYAEAFDADIAASRVGQTVPATDPQAEATLAALVASKFDEE